MVKKVFKVPPWHGRHPFPSEEKRPMVITRDKVLNFLLYGKTAYTDMNWLYVSSDKIHVGIYLIPPGGRFDPPDIHEGDEVYYMLEGTLTILNPENNEVHEVLPGEGLLIPKGCWHQGHNFGDKYVKGIWGIAPLMWNLEEGPPTEYVPPVRKTPLRMKVLNREIFSRRIVGKEHRIPITHYVDTSMIHLAEITIPLNEYSEPEKHKGDEVVFPLEGKLIVFLSETNEAFEVHPEEAFFIPEGLKHQYYNFTNEILKAAIMMAP